MIRDGVGHASQTTIRLWGRARKSTARVSIMESEQWLFRRAYLKLSFWEVSVGESSMGYSFLSEASRSSRRSFGERGPSGI